MRVRLVDKSEIRLDHEMIWGSIGLALGLVGWVWPADRIPCGCPFKALVGFACPTCGVTRALLGLRRFDVLGALAANPLVALLSLFAAAYCLYAWTTILFRTRRIRIVVTRRWEPMVIRVLVVAVFFANWFYVVLAGR